MFAVAVVLSMCAQSVGAQETAPGDLAPDTRGQGADSVGMEILNDTDAGLSELFVSPAHRYTWGPNVLLSYGAILQPGTGVEVMVRQGEAYDIYAVDKLGREYSIRNAYAGRWNPIEINESYREEAQPDGAVDPDLGYLVVNNHTGYALHHLYSSPSYAASWAEGEHLLPEAQIIDAGERFFARFDVTRWGTMVFDLVAEDEDGDFYVLRRINLRNEYEITINLNHIRFY